MALERRGGGGLAPSRGETKYEKKWFLLTLILPYNKKAGCRNRLIKTTLSVKMLYFWKGKDWKMAIRLEKGLENSKNEVKICQNKKRPNRANPHGWAFLTFMTPTRIELVLPPWKGEKSLVNVL